MNPARFGEAMCGRESAKHFFVKQAEERNETERYLRQRLFGEKDRRRKFVSAEGYQRKYPINDEVFSLVNPARFELATFGSASQRSIQLSYGSISQPMRYITYYLGHAYSRKYLLALQREQALVYHNKTGVNNQRMAAIKT